MWENSGKRIIKAFHKLENVIFILVLAEICSKTTSARNKTGAITNESERINLLLERG